MRRAALALSLLLATSGCGGTGFSMLRVDVDAAPNVAVHLTPGVATYGDVLEHMGPPAAVGDFPDSGEFAFLYEQFHVSEWMGKLSYQGIQAAYSRGTGQQKAVLVVFEPDGKLQSCSPLTRRGSLGWGMTAGHTATPELFFRFRDYLAKDAGLQRWGADLLDPAGKRIRIESGKGVLYGASSTVTFGE